VVKKTLIALFLVPILGLTLLYLLNLSSSLIPLATLEERVKSAFNQGSISDTDWPYLEIPGYEGNLGFDQFTDCLVYMSTILRTADRFRDAISANVIFWRPYLSTSITKAWTRCGTLQDAVEKSNYEDLQPYFYPYHRYLFAHRPLTALAISATSITMFTTGLEYSSYGILLITLLLATRSVFLARRLPTGETRKNRYMCFHSGAMAILAVFFLLFYGLNYYARSISHSMSDLVLFSFLLIALRIDMLRVNDCSFVALMSGFGVLTAFFELLNGSMTIGAALAILAIGMRVSSAKDFRQANTRIASGLVLFLGSLAMALLLKQVIAAIVFSDEDVTGAFVQKLLLRTAGLIHNHNSGEVSVLDMYSGLLRQISLLAFGSRQLGVSVFVVSVCLLIGAGSVIAIRGSQIERYYLWVILLVNAVLAVWFALFTQHAMEHPYYMVRVLVVTMAGGWVITFVLLQRSGIRRQPLTQGDNCPPSTPSINP
jgi:hypothetical protein